MNKHLRLNSILYMAGIVLVAMSALLILFIFYPVLREEINYELVTKNKDNENSPQKNTSDNQPTKKDSQLVPVDKNFGIIIPKINANSPVIADVDSQDSKVYQQALTRGVAHAKGTAYPSDAGNVFIFAHSGVDFWEASRYNAVFYLLGKLETDDDIFIYYKNNKYAYKVSEKKIVGAEDIQYLENQVNSDKLTLMTCWPAGTDWKRLVVIAMQQK